MLGHVGDWILLGHCVRVWRYKAEALCHCHQIRRRVGLLKACWILRCGRHTWEYILTWSLRAYDGIRRCSRSRVLPFLVLVIVCYHDWLRHLLTEYFATMVCQSEDDPASHQLRGLGFPSIRLTQNQSLRADVDSSSIFAFAHRPRLCPRLLVASATSFPTFPSFYLPRAPLLVVASVIAQRCSWS